MGKVYGVVVGGGTGTRMENPEMPKQFMDLGGKPIIIHTIKKFVSYSGLEKVLVLCPEDWVEHAWSIVREYFPGENRIEVLEGGSTRNETIMNAIRYIEKSGCLDRETIIVTHDSVRPFVTHQMIEENIRMAREYGMANTVIQATDTIVESLDNKNVTGIPDRRYMYQGQTPQTFRAMELRETYESLTEEEKEILTDACKIMVLKGNKVPLVEGGVFNMKITYPYDLTVAHAILGMMGEED